ncbi:hypothetical protein H5410_018293, partial [Solanum commersonii]
MTYICKRAAVEFSPSDAKGITSPPQIPDVILPEDIALGVVAALRTEINKALESFRDIASGKELKKFLAVLSPLLHFNTKIGIVLTGKRRYRPRKRDIDMLRKHLLCHHASLINIVSSRVLSSKSLATVAELLGSAGYTKPRKFQNSRATEPSKKQIQSSKGPSGSTILDHRSPDASFSSSFHFRGSFDILGVLELTPGIFNNCIRVHPPSKVRCKFRVRSEIYIALVEFMRIKDLVMRMLINDVELLMLPSNFCMQ